MTDLPFTLLATRWVDRLQTAHQVVESVAAALMVLRKGKLVGREACHGQLKTAIDKAAEGWVLGYLREVFPHDRFLCEELYEQSGWQWIDSDTYWTIDALDGTRSFVDGFDGFCVQVAYVQDDKVQFGVVYEPVSRVSYVAAAGMGSYKIRGDGKYTRLQLGPLMSWPPAPVFVDSSYPTGIVGALLNQVAGQFLECGSIGLKICRVAENAAHVFAKALTFKLWDVAPGDLILNEAGGKLGLLSGKPVSYRGEQVYFENLLAAPCGLFDLAVEALSDNQREGKS